MAAFGLVDLENTIFLFRSVCSTEGWGTNFVEEQRDRCDKVLNGGYGDKIVSDYISKYRW